MSARKQLKYLNKVKALKELCSFTTAEKTFIQHFFSYLIFCKVCMNLVHSATVRTLT